MNTHPLLWENLISQHDDIYTVYHTVWAMPFTGSLCRSPLGNRASEQFHRHHQDRLSGRQWTTSR